MCEDDCAMDDSEKQPAEPPIARPVLNYANPQTGRMQAIARFPQAAVAHMAASRLEGEGIWCMVMDGEALSWGMGSGAGILIVAAEDVPRTLEVLARTSARRWLLVPESQLPPAAPMQAPKCIRCGSLELRHPSRKKPMIVAAVALSWLVLLGWAGVVWYAGLMTIWAVLCLKDRPWLCERCGYSWHPRDVVEADEPHS